MNAITLVKAARLRTLPLSVSGIITGSAVALREKPEAFRWDIFLLALLTTVLFQILSNFANDYGDGVKGTDNEHRIGPARALPFIPPASSPTSVPMLKALTVQAKLAAAEKE